MTIGIRLRKGIANILRGLVDRLATIEWDDTNNRWVFKDQTGTERMQIFDDGVNTFINFPRSSTSVIQAYGTHVLGLHYTLFFVYRNLVPNVTNTYSTGNHTLRWKDVVSAKLSSSDGTRDRAYLDNNGLFLVNSAGSVVGAYYSTNGRRRIPSSSLQSAVEINVINNTGATSNQGYGVVYDYTNNYYVRSSLPEEEARNIVGTWIGSYANLATGFIMLAREGEIIQCYFSEPVTIGEYVRADPVNAGQFIGDALPTANQTLGRVLNSTTTTERLANVRVERQ